MAVSQVGDVIRLAMQNLEALQAGGNPSAQEYTDGVDWLNVMLSNWEADESLKMVPNLFTDDFDTVAGTASYTAGTSGTAYSTRPIRIVHAYSSFGGVDRTLQIKGKADYDMLQNKSLAGCPEILYYVPAVVGTIYFDRVPDAIYTITCELQNPVGDYANQDTPLNVSPEYRAAMIYNLTVVLAPVYGVPLTPFLASEAKRTRERIQYQSHNAQALDFGPTATLIV